MVLGDHLGAGNQILRKSKGPEPLPAPSWDRILSCSSGWSETHHVDQACSELIGILLSLLPKCWNWRCMPPCSDQDNSREPTVSGDFSSSRQGQHIHGSGSISCSLEWERVVVGLHMAQARKQRTSLERWASITCKDLPLSDPLTNQDPPPKGSKIVPQAGDPASRTWACRERFQFKLWQCI